MGPSPTPPPVPAPRAERSRGLVGRVLTGALCLALLAACASETTGPTRASAPERLRAHLDLANGYYETGDLARAKKPLEFALEIDPRSWEANNLLGRIYQREGEVDLAERHFRIAVRSAPDNARVRNDFGVFLYQQQRYGDAREQLRVAVEDPDNPLRSVAYENLGLASLAVGDRAAAREAFARAVTLDPRTATSLLELALLAFGDGEFGEAARWYDRYRNVARQSPRSLWLGIRLARLAGDDDALASYALQLRNLYPYSDEYRLYRESVADG